MIHEHVKFHYTTLSRCHWRGMILQGCRMVTIKPGYILPVINTDEIPDGLPMSTHVCLQEVIDENNKHALMFFNVTHEHHWD